MARSQEIKVVYNAGEYIEKKSPTVGLFFLKSLAIKQKRY